VQASQLDNDFSSTLYTSQGLNTILNAKSEDKKWN